jgi:hypothetical protein
LAGRKEEGIDEKDEKELIKEGSAGISCSSNDNRIAVVLRYAFDGEGRRDKYD